MGEQNKNAFNLNENFYENMKKAINTTDSFEKQIISVKKSIKEISEVGIKLKTGNFEERIISTKKVIKEISEVEIKLKADSFEKQIIFVKKAINEIRGIEIKLKADSFEKQIIPVKKSIKEISEVEIKLKTDSFEKQIISIKKAIKEVSEVEIKLQKEDGSKKSDKSKEDNKLSVKDVISGYGDASDLVKDIGKLRELYKSKFPNKPIGKAFSGFGENISKAIKTIRATIKGANIGKTVKDAFGGIPNILKNVQIGKALKDAFNEMPGILKSIIKEMPNILKLALSPIGKVFTGLGNIISKFAVGAIEALMGLNPMLLLLIVGVGLFAVAWENNFLGIRDAVEKDIKEIVERLDYLYNHFNEIWRDALKKLGNLERPTEGESRFEKNPADKCAVGTSYFHGGWTWVGEQGPELMKLPGGTQIVDNRKSQAMAGSSLSISKLADTIVVREDADIDRITDALAKKLTNVSFNCA